MKNIRTLAALCVLISLYGCGGGSGEMDTQSASGQSYNSHYSTNPAPSSDTVPSVGTVDTIAALRAKAEPSSMVSITVRGYYAANDGGGGDFHFDTASSEVDNGGTIIKPNGTNTLGRWKRVLPGWVTPAMFGARGDGRTVDTAPVQQALNAYDKVKLEKIYIVSGLKLNSNNYIFGTGKGVSGFRKDPAVKTGFILAANPYNDGTSNPAENLKKVTIRDVGFYDNVSTQAFSEYVHELILNAVSDVLVDNCGFYGFRGDGVYIGSTTANLERHNERIRVQNSEFDGENKDNRNGISVIDGTDITIESNTFTRSSRSDMPGPIDVEPDGYNFARIRDITIRNNVLDGNGGMGGISFYLPNSNTYVTPPSGFNIVGNLIKSANTFDEAIQLRLRNEKSPFSVNSSTPSNSVVIDDNEIYTGNMTLRGLRGLQVSNNRFLGSGYLQIGETYTAAENALDISVSGNKFARSGSTWAALVLGNVASLKILSNAFQDPGPGAKGHYAIHFQGDDTTWTSSRDVTIKQNTATGTLTYLVNAYNHNFEQATTVIYDNNPQSIASTVKYVTQ